MATAVPSRFAVLAIDDDDCKPKKNQKSSPVVKQSKNKIDKVKQQQAHQQQPKKDEKKKSNNKNKKKKNGNENQQWEQWKEKDSMAVEEAYQHELHQAMLLSKLTYESQLDNEILNKDRNGSTNNPGNNKKPKKATMSLEEFNNMVGNDATEQPTIIEHEKSRECERKESNAEFFDRLDKEAKEEIMRNKERDMLKSRLNTMDDDITLALLKVRIEQRDGEIVILKDEISSLKHELSQVKERNKKLYQILSHGEMKDKASVLAEVAKLQEIRDELTSEVSSLYAQLEQERSKTRTSVADTTKSSKQTNKKRPASENA